MSGKRKHSVSKRHLKVPRELTFRGGDRLR